MEKRLVAVRREDRNGRLVTRYVRPDGRTTAAKPLPAPTITQPQPPAAYDPTLEQRRMLLDAEFPFCFRRADTPIRANGRLAAMFQQDYRFSCSSNEFYDLLERLRLDDAIVLKSASMQPSQLDEFIRDYRFEPYLEDNRELVADLRARGIGILAYADIATDPRFADAPREVVLDAAEAHELYLRGFGEISRNPESFASLILEGRMRLQDFKDIGMKNCTSDREVFRRALARFNEGDSVITARELGEMLDRRKGAASRFAALTETRVNVAMDHGVAFADSIRHYSQVWQSYVYARENLHSRDRRASFLRYADESSFEGASGSEDTVHAQHRYWEAGIPAETARDLLGNGMSIEQNIAIHTEGIAPSVAGGWL